MVICIIYMVLLRRRSSRVLLTAFDITTFIRKIQVNTTSPHRIPRIIHQTWKTKQVPKHWKETVRTVRTLNAPHFEYRLWTDEDIHAFVRQEEPYLYNHTFLKYPLDIQRIDAFRYIVLHRLGGIYIDMDNGCIQPFDTLLNVLEMVDAQSAHLAAFPRTSPVGISNGFMIATKGHPLFKTLVSHLSLFNHNYLVDYLTVMLTTGPLYLSVNEFYFDKSIEPSAVRILDETVYSSLYTWHTPENIRLSGFINAYFF
ncbi:unnamed protein product [Adineta ricciae]|uniref:Uncharacterized protein n=1 Tax=Adineta ricciae TaxID=249248 RepID=A0A814D3W9_ADIRI|nr:unnamed protein product [Adineta ricciae]